MLYRRLSRVGIMNNPITREHLCEVLRIRPYLEREEIDAIFIEKEFFQPYLQNALTRRVVLGGVPDDEKPVENTDFHAIFLLSHLRDTSILRDILQCFRFSEDDLWTLYGDDLTEDMWLPFALIAQDEIENLWDFVVEDSADRFARDMVVKGLIAMAVLFPETRQRVIRFVEKILAARNLFEEQRLGSILCDCGDFGLNELKGRAFAFADAMTEYEDHFLLECTADDVCDAFQGEIYHWTKKRLSDDVFTLNQKWKRYAQRREEEERLSERKTQLLEEDNKIFIPQVEPLSVKKIQRNEPCPCGSGSKYKRCCGK